MTIRRMIGVAAIGMVLPGVAQAQDEKVSFFKGGQPVLCDGRQVAESFFLHQLLPSVVYPARVVEAFVAVHVGTGLREGQPNPLSPLPVTEPVGGFFTIGVSRPDGLTLLIADAWRNIAARWLHAPPVVVRATDLIVVNWSCFGRVWDYASGTSALMPSGQWGPFTGPSMTVQPDWGLGMIK